LLSFIQQNFLSAVEIVISRLPNEALNNKYVDQLQNILKNKRKKSKKEQSHMSIFQLNEQIV